MAFLAGSNANATRHTSIIQLSRNSFMLVCFDPLRVSLADHGGLVRRSPPLRGNVRYAGRRTMFGQLKNYF
jgi:hypothetical protein